MASNIPNPKEPIAGPNGLISPTWYRFLGQFHIYYLSSGGNIASGLQVVNGQLSIAPNAVTPAMLQITTYTVASLPTASTQRVGTRLFVTDANSTTFASIAAGGGTNKVPVYSDGTNWRIG